MAGFGSNVSTRFLTDNDARAEAEALAEKLAALAGGVAELYELVSGQPSSTAGYITPSNPQGMNGIDHSGPPWGTIPRCPVAYVGAGEVNSSLGYGNGALAKVSNVAEKRIGPWTFWVRPYDALPRHLGQAPLSQLPLSVMAWNSGAGTPNLTFTCDHDAFPDDQQTTGTCAPFATTPKHLDTTLFVPTVPGLNTIWLRVVSDSALITSIGGLYLYNSYKRVK